MRKYVFFFIFAPFIFNWDIVTMDNNNVSLEELEMRQKRRDILEKLINNIEVSTTIAQENLTESNTPLASITINDLTASFKKIYSIPYKSHRLDFLDPIKSYSYEDKMQFLNKKWIELQKQGSNLLLKKHGTAEEELFINIVRARAPFHRVNQPPRKS